MKLIFFILLLNMSVVVAEQRLALVIGNSDYPDGAYLENPKNDAADMAKVLRKYGFTVIHEQDLSQEQMDKAIINFGRTLSKNGIGLFYFAGHGIQIDQRNYLVPIGNRISGAKMVKYRAIDAQWVVDVMGDAGSRISIVILDACRNNPFRSYFRSVDGLAAMHAPKGTIISYATALGKKSSDGVGRNGLYTKNLLDKIRLPGLTVEEVFKQTATAVDLASDGRQVPWRASSLVGKDFCFGICGARKKDNEISDLLATCESYMNQYWFTSSPTGTTALNCYQQVLKKQANNQSAFQGLKKIETYYSDKVARFLQQGRKQQARTYLARLRLVAPELPKIAEFESKLQTVVPPPPIKVSEPVVKSSQFKPGQTFQDRLKDGGLGPKMVVIPQGRFKMGDIQGYDREKPVHWVNINYQFSMGKYEVTFAEYDKFAGATGREKPSDRGWGRGNRPVINVSWDDAVAYTEWLSQQTGKEYRLPSESEWEYAARAGTETKYWWGNYIGKNKANCYECGSQWDNKQTAPVGSFEANQFGLYDTVGNVWEWCADNWHGNYENAPTDGSVWRNSNENRVLRGGSWLSDPSATRAADRYRDYFPFNYIGFRVVSVAARTF